MNEWSTPIGGFTAVEEPSPEQYQWFLDDIARMPHTLRLSVESLSPDQLDTPYRPGGWTIRQVVHHLADNDMNAYIRFKRGLTEDSPTAGFYRGDLWADLEDYSKTPLRSSIDLIGLLRGRLSILLHSLEPAHLQRMLVSPTHGPMTLNIAVQRFSWHGRHHLAQIESLKTRMGWQLS